MQGRWLSIKLKWRGLTFLRRDKCRVNDINLGGMNGLLNTMVALVQVWVRPARDLLFH